MGGNAAAIVGEPDAGLILPGFGANREGASTLERILGVDRDIQQSPPEFILVHGDPGIAVELLFKTGALVLEQGLDLSAAIP